MPAQDPPRPPPPRASRLPSTGDSSRPAHPRSRAPGPPSTPARPSGPGRRASAESTARTRPIISPVPMRSTGGTPPPLPSRSSPSVFSGREGSTFSRRGEAVTSPPPAELELFKHHCRLFYFDAAPSEESASYISRTLAALPPAHRAAYTRVQSSLRSEAHLHHLRVRISSFHALMASTTSNGSLSLPARNDLTGARGQAERAERLGHFLRTWASADGALEPFFRGLWSVFRAQSRGNGGGAGPRRVCWEVEDAVLESAGGPEFMQEAVTVIKGVLGFEDQALSTPPILRRVSSARGGDSDVRPRAGSDPFTDGSTNNSPRKPSGRGPAPPPPPSRGKRSEPEAGDSISPLPSPVPPLSPLTPSDSNSPLLPETERLLGRPPLPPRTSASPLSLSVHDEHDIDSLNDDDRAIEEADLNTPRFRIWIFPAHITDEEAEALLALFPRFVHRMRSGRSVDVYFRPNTTMRAKDVELGLGVGGDAWTTINVAGTDVAVPRVDCEDEAGVVRSGTGRMWIGNEERLPGWDGGGWFRFMRWWRSLFGMA